MNSVTFGKTMDNLRKHSNIMFVSTDKCKIVYCQIEIALEQNSCPKNC